jgi:uncharacterized membrane protein
MPRVTGRLRSAAPWLAALAVYGVSVWFARSGLHTHAASPDVTLYARDAHAIAHGSLPYRDLYFEYPPGALAPILAVEPAHDYAHAFKLLAAGLGLAMLLVAGDVLRLLRASLWRLLAIAVAPLALGSVFLTRYDVWPALLTIAGIALLVRARPARGLALLGLGTATKVFPLAAAPAALAWTWRRAGRGAARRALVAFVAVVALVVLPFAALGPGGVAFSFYIQLTRHLETESLGGSLLLVADRLGIYHANVHTGKPGSLDVFGTVPTLLGAVSLLVVVAAIVWIAARDAEIVTAAAAALAAYVAFGKVLSPQYLLWLVPVVPLARSRLAPALLLVALLLTQWEFDHRYHELHTIGPVVWILLARNLVLVALAILLLLQVRGANQTSNPPPVTSR